MTDELVLLETTLQTNGMLLLHFVQVGSPVDVERVIEQYVPLQSRWGGWGTTSSVEGETIKRHHLDIWFPKRGVVQGRLADGRLVNAVLWMLKPEERISMGIQDAADVFWGAFDVAPASALVNKLPKDAPAEMVLSGCCPGAVVKLGAKETVPKGGVLVA